MKAPFKPLILTLILVATTLVQSQNLQQNFQTPPNAAKPRVWWHWMNGNISKEGIQKDLEWMERVGIGGFQNFDANLMTPVVVPKKLVFMTPEWKDAFKFTTALADKKKLEMAIAGSPGWSVTGGPWVEPKDGMKKYVWTETRIEGGKTRSATLQQPSGVLSSFQNVELSEGGLMGGFVGPKPVFYRDAAVVAYRIPASEKTLTELNPKVTSSGGEFTLKNLTDGDLHTGTYLPPKEPGEDMWIQYEFATPQTFKALSVVGADHSTMEQFNGSPENRSLKVSDDGVSFREIAKIHGSAVPQTTVSFQATTAKFFRFAYKTLPGQPNFLAAMMGGNVEIPKPTGVQVAEFVLHNTDRIDKAEDKAGFLAWREHSQTMSEAKATMTDAIAERDIIDLTPFMQADGTINFVATQSEIRNQKSDINLPTGNWQIIRFGYSLTGRQNHPASPEATGLEVDKLDKEAVKRYINTYLDMYKDATGGLMGAKGLTHMILDSYEAGHMNWTKAMLQDFKTRRGYDLTKWIPALTGRIVNSSEETEKFLWDFRKTIGEMIAENHYDAIGEELHKRGMKRYTESHEGGRIYLADGMDVKRNAEVPMSAMWTPGSLAGGKDEEARSEGDIREAASVANIYGQNIVAAESMTSVGRPFQEHPERLKRTADLEMASGLNRFVIHTSVHQPLDDKKPGFSLGPFGQYFTRQETWAEAGGKAWMGYLGRSSYMLQQGQNVADILYLYGENTNITLVCKDKLPTIPAGFEFDFVNSSALLNVINAKNGKLVAKSGNSYHVLMLDESTRLMTLPVLKKIKMLADAGIKIIGTKPEKSPSLSDDNATFHKIADEIWPNVRTGRDLSVPIKPDVIISKNSNKILFRHRTLAPLRGIDIYWLNNRSENPTDAEVSFRVTGKIPELWNAETGKIEKVSYKIENGRTIVPLHFESWDAYFIVFEKNVTSKTLAYTKPKTTETVAATLTTPWQVTFPNKGTPWNTSILSSWSENTADDIKYFSGTAIYENKFQLSTLVGSKEEFVIDFGDVKNIAEVIVNGKNVGTIWKKPFRVDISGATKRGENIIQIKVTNVWVNRLIGDAQPNAQKSTFTTMPFYRGKEALLPSGLLGPVSVLVKK
jgi:alpha-L-rhamnosidase